jgi:hypothetical protein
MSRQGKLDQDTVNGRVRVQGLEQLQQACFGAWFREAVDGAADPDLMAGTLFVPHVDLTSGVVAHEDRRQAGGVAEAFLEQGDFLGDFAANLIGYRFAV